MQEFIRAKKDRSESFKRISHIFGALRIEQLILQKLILKYVKDVNQITFLYWCWFILDKLISSVRHYKESKTTKGLNEAQTKAIRSMGYASFLKVDLKQILGKFSKWLVEIFDPYSICFRLPNGQKFSITTFNVYMTLGVPIRGRQIMEITKFSMDEEYDLVHVAWFKEWKIDRNALELTHHKPNKADGGPSFSPTLELGLDTAA
ncbi:LOW QUALITY PROTEIN: hypothetical protein Cgig2_027121 [Carnegiea gigantea]|uniref:Uncharacterized protein n=1 Tax=Carnegiea gigantea TaxID=171969 RepID=A0A9Q1JM55_9CARY|nr:LOW QUALITY PROTEIN: hypothetical protein Cgig2_027121 [Carnegiea gigantea]